MGTGQGSYEGEILCPRIRPVDADHRCQRKVWQNLEGVDRPTLNQRLRQRTAGYRTVHQELVKFIREGLGCRCPDEVLADLRVGPQPVGFVGLPVEAVVSVGGRLLVGVCASRPWEQIDEQLGRCFATARRVRDEGGYNRFRLVVVTREADAARPMLERRFEAIPDRDDRLHLHVIDPAVLPDTLKSREMHTPGGIEFRHSK